MPRSKNRRKKPKRRSPARRRPTIREQDKIIYSGDDMIVLCSDNLTRGKTDSKVARLA